MTKRKRKPTAPHSKTARLKANLTRTLLQYIGGKRYEPMTLSELRKQLNIPTMHQTLFDQLVDELSAQKKLGISNGRIVLAGVKERLVTGTISIHTKGFGFVKTEQEGPDIFIPKHLTQKAIDGDLVEVEVAEEISAKGPEGSVIAILKRGRSHLAGTIVQSHARHYTAYAPLLGKSKALLVRSKGIGLHVGDRIICKVTSWDDEELIEGELVRKLGHISDASIDIDAAIEEFELPCGFSKEAVDEAKKFGTKVPAKTNNDRLDLTDWETITIDPDTARDFDDAISLTQNKSGEFLLGVHIADVAHYVKPGSHLDREAYLRCNSTYFPGRCVPMLPEELSNELCSLKPKVKRLTMSVLAKIDASGDVIDYKIVRTVIKSQKRFTYKEALEVLEGKKKSRHAPLLERMVALCHLLKKKRFERGSIEFAMSDDVVIVNPKGVPERIERVEYDITHQMIEEFMLKANELVAVHLTKIGRTPIYRVHEAPSPESFEDFFAFARSLGFKVPPKPTPRDLQDLFVKAKDSPLLPQLSVSFIRSMRLAQYSPENLGHYGLALEHYCHFTSPIRRYTDLITQRLLVNEIPEGFDLQVISTVCSEKERLSFKAESSVVQLKKLRLAETHFKDDPTKVYSAIITRIKPFAIFFEVPMFDLEGSLHVSEIGGDYYEFNPQTMSMRGNRTGRSFIAGQMVHVRLDKLDFVLQETSWSLALPPATKRK